MFILCLREPCYIGVFDLYINFFVLGQLLELCKSVLLMYCHMKM